MDTKFNEKQLITFFKSFFSSYNIAIRSRKFNFKSLSKFYIYKNLLHLFVKYSIIKSFQIKENNLLIFLPYDFMGNCNSRKIYFYQNRGHLIKVNFFFISCLYKSVKNFFNIKYLFLYKNKFYTLEDLYKLLISLNLHQRKKFKCFFICKVEY